MKLESLALLITLALPAVYGQPVQPVREVDREARSAVTGGCLIIVPAGQQTNSGAACNLTTLQGTQLGTAIPAGKILVIEDASANCNKSTADAVTMLALKASGLSSGITRVLPLSTQGTADGINHMVGFTHGRSYFTTNGVGAFLNVAAPATRSVNCSIRLSGHLVDAQ